MAETNIGRRHHRGPGGFPALPATITYDLLPGRDSLWTATIHTGAGRVSATCHSLHETRDALESQLRELARAKSSAADSDSIRRD